MPFEEAPVPDTPVPHQILDLLAKPNPAVMATLAADGRPVTVATWYLLESDGSILLGLDAQRARLDHLRRDPRVSLTALAEGADGRDWYTHVSVQGRVRSIADDEGLRDIDRLSQHYTGKPYANRERARVSVHVEIERWHAWGVESANG
jgi:PPOX class probable F420-dependent enzyme